MAKQLKTAESIAQAASILKVPVTTVRNAKRSGCEAFIPGGRVRLAELRKWLSDQKRKKPAPTAAIPELQLGAPHALARLEAEEASAYSRLRAAVGTFAEDDARRSWLTVSEQLRRHDLAVEEFRRETGDVIERKEVEKLLRMAGWALNVGIAALVPSLASVVPIEVYRQIRDPLGNVLRNAVFSAAAIGTGAAAMLPEWALEALRHGAGTGLATDSAEWKWRVEAVREMFSATTRKAWLDSLDRLAEKRADEERRRLWK